ncbi:hypothetical protein MIND_01288400 [Mycena indigotica]|uniref:C2H2-type domain-containing protein n=1 Tax=Mycena indigotica TaxID=2126181 RepID=A0A8H6S2E7_9AGAR|nr:uncharacterized protein MIND_01288400 [Mycena indigotica]KAF7291433.1 hypothetical protein MIND_01288400 [Mycena indigotica]
MLALQPYHFSEECHLAVPAFQSPPVIISLEDASDSASEPTTPPRRHRRPAAKFHCTGYGECKMVFTRSEHLARHIRKHTGERPFTCHCDKQFSRLDNLRQHVQTVHSDPDDKPLNERMMRNLSAINASILASARGRKPQGSSPERQSKSPSPTRDSPPHEEITLGPATESTEAAHSSSTVSLSAITPATFPYKLELADANGSAHTFYAIYAGPTSGSDSKSFPLPTSLANLGALPNPFGSAVGHIDLPVPPSTDNVAAGNGVDSIVAAILAQMRQPQDAPPVEQDTAILNEFYRTVWDSSLDGLARQGLDYELSPRPASFSCSSPPESPLESGLPAPYAYGDILADTSTIFPSIQTDYFADSQHLMEQVGYGFA